jgi:hypothetical protein
MLLLDTSGLVAALFPDQDRHAECARALESARGALILSPFVLAELDYLVARFGGVSVEVELLAEVARGAYALAPFGETDVDRAARLVDAYRDLGIGLADASIAVLSHRHRVLDLLTLDERHFRTVRGHAGRPFRLLPADA